MAAGHLLTSPRAALLAAALLALAVAPLAPARVFERVGASDAAERLRAAGGRVVYAAPVSVNGAPGRISVARFKDELPRVARRLGRLYGVEAAAEGDLVRFEAVGPDRAARVLAFSLASGPGALVVVLDQSPEAFRRSAAAPDPAALDGLPAFPGSTARFAVADEEAGCRVAVSETEASPAAVQAHFDAVLPAAGWTPTLPGSAGSLRVFARGRELCCTLAVPGDGGRGGLITVLHRRRASE